MLVRKVLLDCDGILADFTGEVLRRVNDRTGKDYHPSMVTSWEVTEVLGIDKKLFWGIVKEPGFCLNLPELPGAREGVKALREMFDVTVVTTPVHSETWHWERLKWLAQLGVPPTDVIFAHDKTRVHGDLLIDDKLSTVERWASQFTKSGAMLWDAPYNQVKSLPINAIRVCGWSDALQALTEGK